MTKKELLRHCEHKPHSLPCCRGCNGLECKDNPCDCIDFYIANFYEINRLRKAEVIEKDYQGSMNEPPCCDVEEYEVIPETVGQYTGLTDKNGKKIFEGDIIQSLETKETAVVQWFPEHSAFMVWCKSSNEVGFLYECTKSNIEVISNIHDNPELLEQEG